MKLSYQSGEKPLWSQLYDILESRILSGEYQEGSILPSEAALMDEFDVSRITVRQAMEKLINAKLISRRRGKGTYVLKHENHVETSFQSSFHGVEEKNTRNDRRVLELKLVEPPIDVAYFFEIPTDQKVLRLIRQTYVENKVMARFETYLNPIVPLGEASDLTGSLYVAMQRNGYPVTHVVEKITASIMSAKEKDIFDRHKNEAVMLRIRKGYSNDQPIEYTYSRYAGHGYELTIDLQP